MSMRRSVCFCFVVLSLFFSGCMKKQDIVWVPAGDTESGEKLCLEENHLEEERLEEKRLEEPSGEAVIYVDVSGAVSNPGVYQLPAGARVYEAIEAAQGFLEEADAEMLNQARILYDEDRIYVPRKGDTEEGTFSFETDGDLQREGEKVNLNTADLQQLMTLTGIGKTRAEAILKYREENGAFLSVEEIMNVQGIKEGTFVKIKDEIVVG